MNKYEFIAQLSSLLRVKQADKQSIIEEYESYIAEALASGELEEEIIASLESPAQIAEHANAELGEATKEWSKDEPQWKDRRSSKSSDFFDDLDEELDKAFKASDQAIKRASETIHNSLKGINFGRMLDKVMDGVDKVVDGVMDMDIKSTASAVAMRFDNSKVEMFAVQAKQVTIRIQDENVETLMVELVQGQAQWMVKYLPTSLKCDIQLNNDLFHIRVPQTNIKFAEKKRMRVYLPEAMEHVNIESNCPIILKDVSTNMTLTLNDVPCTVKNVTMDRFSVTASHAPLSIKSSNIQTLNLTVDHGPLSIKGLDSKSIAIHLEDGPVTLSDIHATSVLLDAGDGPKVFRASTIKELIVQSSGGPISMKEMHIHVLKGHVEGSLIHMKDCHIKDNQLGESE
jgi:hypothetical protein